MHTHHLEAFTSLSPEYTASLLYNWKRRKTQSHFFKSTDVSTDSDAEVRGPLAPYQITHSNSDEQLASGSPTGEPSSSSTSSLLTPRLRPGSSYSGSEVPCITLGRLPILAVNTSVLPLVDASGRLPPCSPSDKKDGDDMESQPALQKRRRLTMIDDQLLRESRTKESSTIRPASRSTRLLPCQPKKLYS